MTEDRTEYRESLNHSLVKDNLVKDKHAHTLLYFELVLLIAFGLLIPVTPG